MRNIFKSFILAMIIGLLIALPISSHAQNVNNNSSNWHGNNSNSNNSNAHNNYSTHGNSNNNNWHGNNSGWHDRSYVGVDLSLLPDNYYNNYPYYQPTDQVLVSPPDYEPVIINGTTYYLNDGTYYVYNGYGYQAVASPVTVSQEPQSVQEPPVVVDNQAEPSPDAITVNIPNRTGGYTAVTLKKSGSGYTGPQGEYYPEFPKVSQLEIMYGS